MYNYQRHLRQQASDTATCAGSAQASSIPWFPILLNYLHSETECSSDELESWKEALTLTVQFLSTQQQGTVLVVPGMGTGFFLALEDGRMLADLWCTDWSLERGASWGASTQKAADKRFAGEHWARDLAGELRAAVRNPIKELERVPGLRVQLRRSLVATLCEETVELT